MCIPKKRYIVPLLTLILSLSLSLTLTVAKQQVVAYTQKSQVKHENRHIQLVREYGFHPRTKASVEDGDVLPRKFEPFPEHMYGKPLEEIDTFIYEEVSHQSPSPFVWFFPFYMHISVASELHAQRTQKQKQNKSENNSESETKQSSNNKNNIN